MTKYDEAMQKIEVTPEMRARILQNAAAKCKPSDQKKPARVIVLRRFAALATPSTAVSAPSAATNALASRRRLSALSGSAVRASITSAESAAWTSFQ